MESAADTDESYDLGYQPSPSSVDQTENSPTETTSYSTISGDSFGYRRMYSEISASSELTDDSSYSDSPSPVCWPAMKYPNQVVLTRSGTRQRNLGIDDNPENHEPVDIGKLLFNDPLEMYLLCIIEVSIAFRFYSDHLLKPRTMSNFTGPW